MGNGLTALDMSDRAIVTWIYPNASPASLEGIVDKSFDNSGPDYGGWGFWLRSDNKTQFWVQGGKDLIDNGVNTVSNVSWSHIAVSYVFATKQAKFYIGGVLNSTQTDATIVEKASGAADFRLGDLRSGGLGANFVLNGREDESGIFDRTIDITEVNDIMDNGLAPTGVTVNNSQVIITNIW